MSKFITIKELALELGYEPRQIRRLIKLGAIPSIKLNKECYRVPKKWLDDMIAKYPNQAEFKQAKEDQLLGIPENKPVLTPIENNNVKVVKEMAKKANDDQTEIKVTPAKKKAFIPNPTKRAKKVAPVESDDDYTNDDYQEPVDDYEPDNDDDNTQYGLPSLFN